MQFTRKYHDRNQPTSPERQFANAQTMFPGYHDPELLAVLAPLLADPDHPGFADAQKFLQDRRDPETSRAGRREAVLWRSQARRIAEHHDEPVDETFVKRHTQAAALAQFDRDNPHLGGTPRPEPEAAAPVLPAMHRPSPRPVHRKIERTGSGGVRLANQVEPVADRQDPQPVRHVAALDERGLIVLANERDVYEPDVDLAEHDDWSDTEDRGPRRDYAGEIRLAYDERRAVKPVFRPGADGVFRASYGDLLA